MKKVGMNFSLALFAALCHLIFAHPSCGATWAFQLGNNFNFSKSNFMIENLDRGRYVGTGATTEFTASQRFYTYLLTPEIIWENPERRLYARANYSYGWIFDGKITKDILKWKGRGKEEQVTVEVGYMLDVCDRFTFLPHLGFYWDEVDIRLKHQRETALNPICFISNDRTRTKTLYYIPYLGFELDFNTKVFCKDIQVSFTYDIGYGWGDGRTTVPTTVITNSPNNSRYGNRIKYRDMIYHDWNITFAYALAKKWAIGLEFDYYTIYNTRKLPVKLAHNKAIVQSGQFTPSQYHVAREAITQTYSITVALNYSFGGEGVWVR